MFEAQNWPEGQLLWRMGNRGLRRRDRGRPWWSEVMGPPPRAERGEVRYLVLSAIRERPRHGYEIIQTIQDSSQGQYRPSPGVIYPTLQMLEELGHVRVTNTEERKAYAITDTGRRDLEANMGSVRDFYDRFEEGPWEIHAEDFAETMKRVGRLLKAFRRGARRGRMTPDVMATIRTALDEALTKIEQAFEPQG